MKVFCRFVSLGILFAVGIQSYAIDQRPNILVILADDMGYGDLGCMGSKLVDTPNLDALAQSGVLCTQAYVASSVCSPSRAGLMTGRDPRRFGYESNLNQSAIHYAARPDLLGLPSGEHTLGDHLRAAGYTTALVGKWHLGKETMEGINPFHPNQRGFDHFCGMLGGSHAYFLKPDNHQLERNGKMLDRFSSDYATDFFTDEGLRFITSEKDSDAAKPWFLFMSYNAPHTPMQATEQDLARFESIPDPRRRTYAAMMFALDRGVGRLCDHLEQTGQRDNTLIVFFSDNGGATNNGSWNGPLSGTKGCMKEGGIRVPMIFSWPAKLPSATRHDHPISSLDLLPTFMTAANADPLPLSKPQQYQDAENHRRSIKKYGDFDGVDLLPQLLGDSDAPSRTLFWRLQGQTAVLVGDEKLIRLSHRLPQLFSPASDPSELTDLSGDQPDRMKELFSKLGEWESLLTTVPIWYSSPRWQADSAKHYDQWPAQSEAERFPPATN